MSEKQEILASLKRLNSCYASMKYEEKFNGETAEEKSAKTKQQEKEPRLNQKFQLATMETPKQCKGEKRKQTKRLATAVFSCSMHSRIKRTGVN